MATSGSAYALPNPGMIDPYPIESVLAKDTSSPLTTLMAYRADRDLAGQNYQQELAAQHQQAYNTLQATMANNAAERVVGAMAHPGGVAYLASQPAFSWIGAGGNQTGLQTYAGPDQQKQIGEAAVPGSTVAKNLSDTSYQLGQGETDFVTGLKTQPGIPVPVQSSTARAQGTQDTQGDTIQVIAGNLDGKPYPVPVKRYFGDTPESFKQRADAQVAAAIAANPRIRRLDAGTVAPGPGTTPAQPATSTQAQPGEYTLPPGQGETPQQSKDIVSGRVPAPPLPPAATEEAPAQIPATPAQAPKGVTSLPVNPNQAKPAGNTTTGQLVLDGKVQSAVQSIMSTWPADEKMDVLAEMKSSNAYGANLPLFPAAGGGLVVKGRSGKFYPVQVTK